MIGMPYLAKYMGLSQEVTGAWLGGSIDTTGAVVASGTLVGETALKISTIVKFSQNVLPGLAAFAISVYWTYANNKNENDQIQKPTLRVIWDRFPKFVLGFVASSLLFSFFRVIWDRFPKFVLGFVASSLLFSFFLTPTAIGEVKEGLKNMQALWFALAFTSIGLETKFADLLKSSNRKPLYAFLISQFFNILVTLVIAYFLFRSSSL
jgi:uncharacterized membrane protein YadS